GPGIGPGVAHYALEGGEKVERGQAEPGHEEPDQQRHDEEADDHPAGRTAEKGADRVAPALFFNAQDSSPVSRIDTTDDKFGARPQPQPVFEALLTPLSRPVADWFAARGWQPRTHQLDVLGATRAGHSVLLIAPTGAGKTLAGFLPSIEDLIAHP